MKTALGYSDTPTAPPPTCEKCGACDMRWDSLGMYKGMRRYRWMCRPCDNARSRLVSLDIKARARAKTRANYPEKEAARKAAKRAVTGGQLVPQPCVRCGRLKVDGHHEDYSKPLEVTWLCRRHHSERHRELAKADRARELAEHKAAYEAARSVAKAAVAAGMTVADVEDWSRHNQRVPLLPEFFLPREDAGFYKSIASLALQSEASA